MGSSLSSEGRRFLVALWAVLALAAACLGLYGAASTPAPPPDARSVIRDPRALLGAPMGLFIGLQQGFIYTSYIKVNFIIRERLLLSISLAVSA